MEGQISLFDTQEYNAGISPFEGGEARTVADDMLKCFKSELKGVEFKTVDDLFSGFNTLKAITFSYSLDFIDRVVKNFDYAEIVLGGDFMVRKDEGFNSVLEEVLTNAKQSVNSVKKHSALMELMAEDRLSFRTPRTVLDHRKMYILKADDGRTRVIKTSANMSGTAWNNSHMETYEYDDTAMCYEEYNYDFETIWSVSEDLPYSVVSSKRSDDLVEGNAILKGVKDKDKVTILRDVSGQDSIEMVKYAIDHEKLGGDYSVLLAGINGKTKDGMFELTPKIVNRIELNKRKEEQKRLQVSEVTRTYPALTFDYQGNRAFLDGEELDLSPADEDVRNDIDHVLQMFDNYRDFVTDSPDGVTELRRTHYKLMNAMFESPFHAVIRCTSRLRGRHADNLPLVILAASTDANCGKTFAITTILKMMTGRDLEGFNKEEMKVEEIRNAQVSGKGVPVFIDELDGRGYSNLKGIIKNPERCEKMQMEQQPVMVFASNDVLDPDDKDRKRILFLRFEGGLRTNIDQNAYKGKGIELRKGIGNALYREYLRRMIREVQGILEYLTNEKDIPAEWYPDLAAVSSKIITEILADYGYEVPEYMAPLTWYADYSANASFVSKKTLEEIRKMYKHNRKAFKIEGDTVIIEFGSDNNGSKMCRQWANTLPRETRAKMVSTRDLVQLVVNREELERLLDMKFGSFWENLFR